MITIPDAMRRPAEVERDELKKQLAEARAEIEGLKKKLRVEITESLDHLLLVFGNIRWYEEMELPKKNKLIEQMRVALEYDRIALLLMVEQKMINPDGITLRANKAALAAERGE